MDRNYISGSGDCGGSDAADLAEESILIVPLSNFLVYIFLSILMGTLIMQLIPERKKPLVRVPQAVLIGSIVGIVVCTLVPLLELMRYLTVHFELQFWSAARDVLFDYRMGQGWL